MRRLFPYAVPVALSIVLLAACGGPGSDRATPDAPERSVESSAEATPEPSAGAPAPSIEGLVLVDEELSRDHQDGPVEYDRVPPVGGPHHPRWLACDVYDEPVPNEVAVHSLEHGAVWFTHAPDLPAGERARLAELAGRNPEYVLVSPLRGLDSRIVAVAWGASLEASSADDPRLEQFLEAYAGGGQGGEPGAPCRTNGLTLQEAQGLLSSQA